MSNQFVVNEKVVREVVEQVLSRLGQAGAGAPANRSSRDAPRGRLRPFGRPAAGGVPGRQRGLRGGGGRVPTSCPNGASPGANA